MMLRDFLIPGKASFILGGQFGSEAKGAAAAWVAHQTLLHEPPLREDGYMPRRFDIVTTNAGAQAGHTSIHDGVKRVVFHLPTAPLVAPGSVGYLNAGSVIDPAGLFSELALYGSQFNALYIHPNAAMISQECREAEGRADSAQTKIASTRKGVGEALARKVLRSGYIAKTYPTRDFDKYISSIPLNRELSRGKSVLVEVPQGIGLSLNGPFYPHCTSRDCTVMQAASDAQIHPSFVGPVMLVLRTFPIRVGNIKVEGHHAPTQNTGPYGVGSSGGCYPDQREITWVELGVEPEITTVTKRVRRVFTWSHRQVVEAFASARPTHVFLSHVDYIGKGKNDMDTLASYVLSLESAALEVGIPAPQLFYSTGPTTADVQEWTP